MVPGRGVRDTVLLCTVLQLFFEDCDYRVTEGSRVSRSLRVHYYGPVQNPFTLILRTMSVSSAESIGLGNFIGSEAISNSSKATASMNSYTVISVIFRICKNESVSFINGHCFVFSC